MSRKDRRANPDQWWKLVGYFDKDTKTPHALGDQYAQYVKGSIDDILVIQLPDTLPAAERLAIMRGIQEVLSIAEKDQRVLIVTDSVKFVRVQPLDPATCKSLDKQMTVRRIEANVRAGKAEIGCPHGRRPGQPCPHCMGISTGNPGAGGSA